MRKVEEFEKIPLKIRRKPYRRNLCVHLNLRGEIEVRTPVRISKKEIKDFLIKHKKWILKQWRKIKEENEKYPHKQIKEGEVFLFLGKQRTLRFYKTLGTLRVELNDSSLCVFIPLSQWKKNFLYHSHDSLKPVIFNFYKKNSLPLLTQRLEFWGERMKLVPKKVSFKYLKSMWGSCSLEKNISLNWKLILTPLEVIDYVIIHELSHLKYFNHSREFWSLVASYCPHYKQHKKYLSDYERSFQFMNDIKETLSQKI